MYEKFYESNDLKTVRDALDPENSDSNKVTDLVHQEHREFTDYLNFFEFVAVLGKSKQLKAREIEDLFGYYLDCLEKWLPVRNYIAAEAKGYEQLNRLLRRRAKKR